MSFLFIVYARMEGRPLFQGIIPILIIIKITLSGAVRQETLGSSDTPVLDSIPSIIVDVEGHDTSPAPRVEVDIQMHTRRSEHA